MSFLPYYRASLVITYDNAVFRPQIKTKRVKMNIHKLQNLEHALRHLEKEGVSHLLVNVRYNNI